MNKLDDKSGKPGITVSRFVLHDILHKRIASRDGTHRVFDRVNALPEVGPDNLTTPWDEVIQKGYDAIRCGKMISLEQLAQSNLEKGFMSTSPECVSASGPIVVVKLDMRGVRCIDGGIPEMFDVILGACSQAFPRLIPASPQSLCRVLPHLVDENGALAEVFGGPSSEVTFCSPVLFCPHDDGFQYAVGIRIGRRVQPPGLVHLNALLNAGDVRLLFRVGN